MKQRELHKCCLCGKGVMHAHDVSFFRVQIERFVIDLGAVQRQHGLEQMLGGHAGIAAAMGPDEDVAKPLDRVNNAIVCEPCARDSGYYLSRIMEAVPDRDDKTIGE